MKIDLTDGRWEQLYPNNKNVKEFFEYCDLVGVTYPDVYFTNGECYTSASEVGIAENQDVDIPHLFGHFLCDYHAVEPDVVAEIVKKMIVRHKQMKVDSHNEKATQYNMGLYR